jgi:hopanoid biosynthesis associated protein HpnK
LKKLVVTADDFGMAPEVNEAVERGHRDGILTATSLMVSGVAAADAVARARAMPSLRVGLHIDLAEGRPVLPVETVPDLVNSEGRFHHNMVISAFNIFLRPSVRLQMEAEITAQFEAFAATGLTLDHVNTHKHFHLHPTISAAILKIGPRYGMRGLRVPWEDASVLRAAQPMENKKANAVDTFCAAWLHRRIRNSGLVVADTVFGTAWTGSMTAARLRSLIACLPDGLMEIYLHPATRDGGFEGAAAGHLYREELAALTDPAVIAAAHDPQIRLGGYSDFAS